MRGQQAPGYVPRRAIEADKSTIPPSPRLMPLLEQDTPRTASRQVTRRDITALQVAPPVTPEQWQQLLGLIATGVRQPSAIEALGIDKVALEGMLRADPAKYRAWREAIIAADRLGWSVEAIEGICLEIMNKGSLAEACQAWDKTPGAFLSLVRRDPTIKEMYDEARIIATELESDELRDISDEDSNDILEDGKGGYRPNTAAVNRSKLRVETRLRLMAAFNRQRFADPKAMQSPVNVNTTVNINHADRLESARARHKKVLEGEAVEVLERRGTDALVPADEEDTSWLD